MDRKGARENKGKGRERRKKRFQRISGLDGELGECLCVCHMFLNRMHMAPRGFIHPSVSLSHVSNPLMSLPIKQTHCQPGSERGYFHGLWELWSDATFWISAARFLWVDVFNYKRAPKVLSSSGLNSPMVAPPYQWTRTECICGPTGDSWALQDLKIPHRTPCSELSQKALSQHPSSPPLVQDITGVYGGCSKTNPSDYLKRQTQPLHSFLSDELRGPRKLKYFV